MRIKKLITPELVEELLNKTEFNEDLAHDEFHMQNVVLEYYNAKLIDPHSTLGTISCDYFIYEESTADGYSVYIATEDDQNICVGSDIHYYDCELTQCLKDAITSGYTIRIEDQSDYYVNDAIEDLYIDLSNLKEEEIIKGLIEEGYSYED
tara:strand:+ start:410 stop:862 length:453 start_codon:yes stop_codon:yes gene_type:complete